MASFRDKQWCAPPPPPLGALRRVRRRSACFYCADVRSNMCKKGDLTEATSSRAWDQGGGGVWLPSEVLLNKESMDEVRRMCKDRAATNEKRDLPNSGFWKLGDARCRSTFGELATPSSSTHEPQRTHNCGGPSALLRHVRCQWPCAEHAEGWNKSETRGKHCWATLETRWKASVEGRHKKLP